MSVEQVTISAQIEKDLRDEMQEVAEKNDRSFSAELRRALRIHVLAEKTISEAVDAA